MMDRYTKVIPIFTFFYFFLLTVLTAQDAKEDFKKINEAYLKNAEYSMNVVYNLYESAASKVLFQTEKATLKQSHGNQYYKISNFETLFTGKYSVMLDHETKLIRVTAPKVNKQKNIFSVDLDTVLSLCKSVQFAEAGATQRVYKLKTDYSQYEEIDIYFNKDTYFIEKMVLFYSEKTNLRDPENTKKQDKPRMEILCNNLNLKPAFPKGTFSESKYLAIKGKKIDLQPAYKTYQLIIQL